MNKYITLLALVSVAGTSYAQFSAQLKHPGIIARQLEQKKAQIDHKQLLKQHLDMPTRSASLVDEDELQVDSITVVQFDVLKRAEYYSYYDNGNLARVTAMGRDNYDEWIETDRDEWTEDYPEMGSSYTEYGFDDDTELYGALTKTVITGNNEESFCRYYFENGEWVAFGRVSQNELPDGRVESVAYYEYDEQGNELLSDSIAYTYDEEFRLVRETYYLNENGQVTEAGYYATSYEDVETPAGPGERTTISISNDMFKDVSEFSFDLSYFFNARYEKNSNNEWETISEVTTYTYVGGFETVSLSYKNNAVKLGEKQITTYEATGEEESYETLKYTCATDTTQWDLTGLVNEVFYTEDNEFGRTDEGHVYYEFIFEDGELTDDFVLSYDETYWTGPYTCCQIDYYDGYEDMEELNTIYYHDPQSTAIAEVQAAKPNNDQRFDLFGRRVNSTQLGSFIIKDGHVQRVAE